METDVRNLTKRFSGVPWLSFFVKACLLVAVLFLISCIVAYIPAFFVALIWAALSFVSAIGVEYHVVVRKIQKQLILKEGGVLSRINNGRVFSLIVSFTVSAACIFGLITASPTWGLAEWLLIIAAIPLFFAISHAFGKVLGKEYEPLFRTSRVVVISSLIVGAVLCIINVLIMLFEPVASYSSAAEAFAQTQQPLSSSSSVLLAEIGRYGALIDGLSAYGLSKVAEFSAAGYLVLRVVIFAAAFFGVANLIGICSLPTSELRRVFLPLENAKENAGERNAKARKNSLPVKRYVAVAGVLPAILVVGFLIADFGVARASETEEYTAAEQLIQDQVDLAVYVIDGKYYDQKAVERIMAEAHEQSEQLAAEAQETLVPLINEAYDKRLENVDPYLDWYYTLPADYERLAQIFTGTVEEGMQQKLGEMINEGIDDAQLNEALQSYVDQATALETDLSEQLAEHEVTDVPDWLIKTKDNLSQALVMSSIEPTNTFLNASERLGIGVGAGVIAGVVSKKLVQRALTKPFFRELVSKLTNALASRGLGAAVGGSVGTVIVPGIGTAAGAVAGTAFGFLSDYLLLKADEALNREEYRNEIVAAIEEERAAMLALVQPDNAQPEDSANTDVSE